MIIVYGFFRKQKICYLYSIIRRQMITAHCGDSGNRVNRFLRITEPHTTTIIIINNNNTHATYRYTHRLGAL